MLSQEMIKSENVAYWYFRLNGFLMIPNFVVHPEWGNDQRTDVDILGVRFPHRKELFPNTMADENVFTTADKTYVLIAEVKRDRCDLNGAWTSRERNNVERVLRAVGCFDDESLPLVAEGLYEDGMFEDDSYRATLFLVGSETNPGIMEKFRDVPQVIWPEVLRFIHGRFRQYQNQKSSHNQWDSTGKRLWEHFERHRNDQGAFAGRVLAELA